MVVVELAIMDVALPNLDVTDVKLVFTAMVGSYFKLGDILKFYPLFILPT